MRSSCVSLMECTNGNVGKNVGLSIKCENIMTIVFPRCMQFVATVLNLEFESSGPKKPPKNQ